jgi:hypothetical protein
MMRLAVSPAARLLLRALTARAGTESDRILLTDAHSTEWQSLTFTGERHHIALRVTGPDSASAVDRMCAGLEDAEFNISGLLVADIRIAGSPRRTPDGAIEIMVEALTLDDR